MRLVPLPAAATALDDFRTAERMTELTSDHVELLCTVAHLGTADTPASLQLFLASTLGPHGHHADIPIPDVVPPQPAPPSSYEGCR